MDKYPKELKEDLKSIRNLLSSIEIMVTIMFIVFIFKGCSL